jgi:plastocyanin
MGRNRARGYQQPCLHRGPARGAGRYSLIKVIEKLPSIACAWVLLPTLFCASTAFAASPLRPPGHYYLPDAAASETVTVSKPGTERAEIIVVTQPVATKESGPAETIKRFGEIYAFSPQTIVVHRDKPTAITFWNLQSDDDHDFALLGGDLSILMYVDLPPLKKTSYVFTFHREGLFDFKCMQHQPTMSGQILVLPPARSE